jgi:uncharacterized membrane-anchored protein
MGESTSDFSVHAMNPVLAVVLGFCGFAVALSLQFSVRRYIAWTYWLAVVGVGVFGTMAADVLHVRFGVPYSASSALWAVALLVVFVSWQQTEKTLSFHTVDTPRREAFYWAAGATYRAPHTFPAWPTSGARGSWSRRLRASTEATLIATAWPRRRQG